MARSIETIYAALLASVAADPNLAGLTSASNTALYRNWLRQVATAHNLMEQQQDTFMAEVDAKLARQNYGTATWWVARMLEYRYGQEVVVSDYRITYPDLSQAPTATRAACVVRSDGGAGLRVQVKLAKGASGALEPLTSDELAGAIAYAARIQPAGVNKEIISLSPDQLALVGTVYFDPQRLLSDMQTAVAAALKSYADQLTFDGAIYPARLFDVLQAVPGVRARTVPPTITVTNGTLTNAPVIGVFNTEAGYVVINVDGITLEADVV